MTTTRRGLFGLLAGAVAARFAPKSEAKTPAGPLTASRTYRVTPVTWQYPALRREESRPCQYDGPNHSVEPHDEVLLSESTEFTCGDIASVTVQVWECAYPRGCYITEHETYRNGRLVDREIVARLPDWRSWRP